MRHAGTRAQRLRSAGWALAAGLLSTLAVSAAPLELDNGAGSSRVDSASLLRHPLAQDILVPADASYQRPMRYRAVPLSVLLKPLGLETNDTLEVIASDGFVAQLPADLVLRQGPGQPWLAIETEAAPWPQIPRKHINAGPFYIVWPQADDIHPEQWPYAVIQLNRREAPEKRWPQMQVAKNLPANDHRRLGQKLFVRECMVCHTLNGAGNAQMGPDLNQPMSPVEYFQPQALRQLVRNPASVRHWPGQTMPSFSREKLSDSDLDALLAYLAHMAEQRQSKHRADTARRQ